MDYVTIPKEPLYPMILAMCKVVKDKGRVLSYEDAEAAFYQLIKIGEEQAKEEVQYGNLDPNPPYVLD